MLSKLPSFRYICYSLLSTLAYYLSGLKDWSQEYHIFSHVEAKKLISRKWRVEWPILGWEDGGRSGWERVVNQVGEITSNVLYHGRVAMVENYV